MWISYLESLCFCCKQHLTASQILDYLTDEVIQFSADTPQGDDETLVVLAVEARTRHISADIQQEIEKMEHRIREKTERAR